jgi:DNA-binding MarR family transcriptional regulator
MEKAGWVARVRHEKDRRAQKVLLLAAGRKKYEEVRLLAIDLQQEILSVLPADHRETFLTDLAAVAEQCQQTAQSGRDLQDR